MERGPPLSDGEQGSSAGSTAALPQSQPRPRTSSGRSRAGAAPARSPWCATGPVRSSSTPAWVNHRPLAARLRRTGRFTWTYAGNLGLAQGLETAVEAAGQLGDGFRLILVGEGPRRGELSRMASPSPGTVEIRDPVPPERAVRMLRAPTPCWSRSHPGSTASSRPSSSTVCAMARPVVLASAEKRRARGGGRGGGLRSPANPGALPVPCVLSPRTPACGRSLAARGREFADGTPVRPGGRARAHPRASRGRGPRSGAGA